MWFARSVLLWVIFFYSLPRFVLLRLVFLLLLFLLLFFTSTTTLWYKYKKNIFKINNMGGK
jgi:hypothetical protein